MNNHSEKIILLLKSLKSYKSTPEKERSDIKYWILISLTLIIGIFLIRTIPNVFKQKEGLIQITSHEIFIFAGFVWPILLVIIWFFERRRSIEKKCYRCISPTILSPTVIFGKVESFTHDKYYHIFQFIWLPFSITMLFILHTFSRLYNDITEIIDSAFLISHIQKINEIIHGKLLASSSFRDYIMNEQLIIFVSVLVAISSIINQIRIQKSRIKSGFDLYWWDFRIDKRAYVVRLIMVGVDGFFALYLFLKLITVSIVLYDIIGLHELKVNLFSYSEYGGQEAIVKIYWLIAIFIFIFGIFSFIGSYFHKGLKEYRLLDTLYFILYAVISIGLIIMPMNNVYKNIETQKKQLIIQLNKELKDIPTNKDELKKSNEYFTYINTIKSIKSSVFNIKTIFSPFLLLIVQVFYFVWQFIFSKKTIDVKDILSLR